MHRETYQCKDFPITSLNSKKGKTTNWLTSMKSDCADAFSRDSDPVMEARAHYFTTHSWDWTRSNTEDLSDIFKGLAQEAGLLGESIFKLQIVVGWTGAFETSQLCSSVSTQGAKIPKGGFHQGISKGDGPEGDSQP